MMIKSLLTGLVVTLLLASCAVPSATPPIVVTQNLIVSSPTPISAISYPPGALITPVPTLSAYPKPMSGPTPIPGTSSIPPSEVEPQPGDEALRRDKANVDMNASELVITGTQPKLVTASLSGYLSDPCHHLRILSSPADAQNKINLLVYSVYDPSVMCIMVIKPFQVSYPLGNYSSGHYSVYVNGQLLGEFEP